jgi:hypothetical protein
MMADDVLGTHEHHLVYGTLFDYLTGEKLTDTDDERIRQGISKRMVEELGYSRHELIPRLTIETLFTRNFVTSVIDLTVMLANRYCMIVRYGPGSLVSRERAACAAARVLTPHYRIPLAVVTNGTDEMLIDTTTGKVMQEGGLVIPAHNDLLQMVPRLSFLPPQDKKRQEREKRVLNTFDLDRCCLGTWHI